MGTRFYRNLLAAALEACDAPESVAKVLLETMIEEAAECGGEVGTFAGFVPGRNLHRLADLLRASDDPERYAGTLGNALEKHLVANPAACDVDTWVELMMGAKGRKGAKVGRTKFYARVKAAARSASGRKADAADGPKLRLVGAGDDTAAA